MSVYIDSLKDSEKQITSLEAQKRELEERLHRLTEKTSTGDSMYVGNDLDVHGGNTGEKFKGSIEEIKELNNKISAIQREIEGIRFNASKVANEAVQNDIEEKEYQEQKELRDEEIARMREDERINTFKSIKRAYYKTKGHGLERVFIAISGRTPKWKEIKNYSQEELNYLRKTYTGNLLGAFKTSLDSTVKRMESKKESIEKIEKYKSDKAWRTFTSLLGSKQRLDSAVAYETNSGRHI